MDIVSACGSPLSLGRAHGAQLAEAIATNIALFWRRLHALGWSRDEVLAAVEREAARAVSDDRLEEITGIAEGARVPYPDLLAFNLRYGVAYPEGCTVMWALPDATANGALLFMKTSDKIGRPDMVGDGFYANKEINVVLAFRPEGKPAVIGVGSAGSTGLKMGVNDRGVAAGTNIARTRELRTRAVTTTQERAIDRVQLARDGLEFTSALAAGQHVTAQVAAAPMSTPGNIEFVDPTLAYVVEGSYDRLAVQLYRAGTGSRTNRFVVLHELNDPDDVSSYARYARTQELLGATTGSLTLDDFAAFTRDHAHGPGMNSICRHDDDVRSETTQSALVATIDPASPADSVVEIALGKPCHAWNHADGHLTVSLRFRPEEIPAGFRSGEVWKRFWTEEPFAAEAARV